MLGIQHTCHGSPTRTEEQEASQRKDGWKLPKRLKIATCTSGVSENQVLSRTDVKSHRHHCEKAESHRQGDILTQQEENDPGL